MDSSQLQPNPVIALIPFAILTLGMSISAGSLAKDKGRNIVLWVVLGLIPGVNFWCMPYMIGASNLRLGKKLDLIMAKLDKEPH